MKHIENNIDDDLASAFEDVGGATAPLNFPSPSSNSIATNAVLHISSFSLDLTFKENYQETACFKGVHHQKNFYRLNLIFWIVMGCGIARFGQRGLKTTET